MLLELSCSFAASTIAQQTCNKRNEQGFRRLLRQCQHALCCGSRNMASYGEAQKNAERSILGV